MIAFKISVTDAIMSYTGVYSTYISHDPILGQLKPFAKTVIETVFDILIIKYILVSHTMHEFKGKKITNNQKGQIHKSSLTTRLTKASTKIMAILSKRTKVYQY